MKLIFNVTLLLILGVLSEIGSPELNLNFQQNDFELKFERMELASYNTNFVKYASIITFKYNRTMAVVNITYTFNVDVGNELTAIIQAYKFMSNEYRTFPLRFSCNVCKALAANVAGTAEFIRCGNFTGCPFVKGIKNHVCTWYPDASKLPPLLPNGQYKLEIQLLHLSTEISVTNVYATVFRPIV